MAGAETCIDLRPYSLFDMSETSSYIHGSACITDRCLSSRLSDIPAQTIRAISNIKRHKQPIPRRKPETQKLFPNPALSSSFEAYNLNAARPSSPTVPHETKCVLCTFERLSTTLCKGNRLGSRVDPIELCGSDASFIRNKTNQLTHGSTWVDVRALYLDPIPKFSTIRGIRELRGPGQVDVLQCSELIVYPAGDHKFILHTVVPKLINPLLVLNVLRNQNYIQSGVDRTALESTFLLNACNPGHYEIDIGVGKCTAHLLPYEPQHKGHQGRFAAGYSYFLCGLQSPTVQRVVIRAITSGTDVIVSRSYASDCESFSRRSRKCVPKPETKSGVKSVAEVAPETCEAWQQMLRQEENDFLKDLKGPENELCVERSCFTASELPPSHCRARQQEEPLVTRKALLRALGVFITDSGNPFELRMLNFPCEQCESGLFREMRSLVSRAGDQSKRVDSSSPNFETKYFAQRFRLISRFKNNLNLSDVAWFSICPEEISKHIGRRLATLSRKLGRKICIMDPFCGAGGNIVQAARMDEVLHAYASDISESEVECAQRMADLYSVKEKLSFSVSDVFNLRPDLFEEIDAIVCSPPWGGPSYLEGVYDLTLMEPSYKKILTHLVKFTRNMAFLLPRNVCIDQLVESAAAADSVAAVELEINLLSGKPKTSTVYYGGLTNT